MSNQRTAEHKAILRADRPSAVGSQAPAEQTGLEEQQTGLEEQQTGLEEPQTGLEEKTAAEKPPSDVGMAPTACDGCRELTQRVERLEQIIASQPDATTGSALGTTDCYWICVAVHAFCAAILFTSIMLIQIGYVALLGSLGTLTVCHVLSTRTIAQKTMRTLCSFTIVVSSAMIPMSLISGLELAEIWPFILIGTPPAMLCGWFVAKLFVWVRGWRIVPPGGSEVYPKIQIRHLLVATLAVAVHLTLSRVYVGDSLDYSASELAGMSLYIVIPVLITTVYSCLLARIILNRRRGRMLMYLSLLVGSATLLGSGGYFFLTAWSGESLSDIDFETFTTVIVYSVLAMGLICASSAFTFTMMRQADYRLIHR